MGHTAMAGDERPGGGQPCRDAGGDAAARPEPSRPPAVPLVPAFTVQPLLGEERRDAEGEDQAQRIGEPAVQEARVKDAQEATQEAARKEQEAREEAARTAADVASIDWTGESAPAGTGEPDGDTLDEVPPDLANPPGPDPLVVLPESVELPKPSAPRPDVPILRARPAPRPARPRIRPLKFPTPVRLLSDQLIDPQEDTLRQSLRDSLNLPHLEVDAPIIPFTTGIPLHLDLSTFSAGEEAGGEGADMGGEGGDDAAPRPILSPVTGRTFGLDSTGDRAFQSGVFGWGLSIEPSDGHIVAPIDGTVTSLTATGHAYAITAPDGMEVFIHVGIDTVLMGGVGFTPLVIRGQQVKAGDPIADVDIGRVRSAGYRTLTIMTVPDVRDATRVHLRLGQDVKAGEEVMTVDAEEPAGPAESGDGEGTAGRRGAGRRRRGRPHGRRRPPEEPAGGQA